MIVLDTNVVSELMKPHPISTEDAQIAAICQSTGLDCATRNTGDFDDLELRLINPWGSGRS
jgi:predicted nucleic acid-binding protein